MIRALLRWGSSASKLARTGDEISNHPTGRAVFTVVAVCSGLSLAAVPQALATTGMSPAGSITGSGPTALTNPTGVAVDPHSHDIYVTNPEIDQRQTITVDATGGTFTLSFAGQTTNPLIPLPFNARPEGTDNVENQLESLPAIGAGNVAVTGPNGGPYTVEFVGALAGTEQPQITAGPSHLTGGSASVTVAIARHAVARAEVEKFTPAGEFLFSIGAEVDQVTGADLCSASSSDTCQPGFAGSGPGAFELPNFLAVDPNDGDLYIADIGDNAVSKYDSSGNLLTSWQSGGRLDLIGALQGIAVDPSGDLFVLDANQIYHYTPAGSSVGSHFDPEDEAGPSQFAPFGLAVDHEDHLYAILDAGFGPGRPDKFNSLFGEYIGGEAIEYNHIEPHSESLALDPLTNDSYFLEAGTETRTQPDSYLHGGEIVRHFAFNCLEFKTENGCPLLEEFGTKTVPLADFGEPTLSLARGLAIDPNGTAYVADTGHARVAVFAPLPAPALTTATKATGQTALTLNGTINPGGGGEVTECQFEYTHDADKTQTVTVAGASGGTYTLDISAPATETLSGYETVTGPIAITSSAALVQRKLETAIESQFGHGNGEIAVSGSPGGPYTIEFRGVLANSDRPQLTADPSSLTPAGATVTIVVTAHGVPGGGPEVVAPCEPATAFSGEEEVHAEITGLLPLTTYHYRLRAANAAAGSSSADQTFSIPFPPQVGEESVSEVTADSAAVHASVVAGGGPATFRVQYITSQQLQENQEHGEEEFAHADQSASRDAGSAQAAKIFTAPLGGLRPGTTYHYRVAAENALETAIGAVQTFTTLPFAAVPDTCANAHVRQQTSAAGLLDCRAYELVSAANAGGYDVESNLIPGQTPFGGYPDATGRVLYGIHDGGIPGSGHPTNRGVDPYLATRGENGWTTEYVGVPADDPSATGGPFASTLAEADSSLGTLAIGGEEICSPCFPDGSRGEPIHLPNGELVQGMEGSIPQPAAEPAGFIGRRLSADGSHFVFGSKSQFEPDGNANGDISIYDRNLSTDITHVVSKTPSGATMTGSGIGELDISADGSRILIGQLVSEVGNAKYWHLYMNVGDSSKTIDLTSGATKGVLYDGMTADGSKVFFSSEEHLTGTEVHHSGADLYMWEEATNSLTLISRGQSEVEGEPGDTASCNPAANSGGPHWNTAAEEANCGVVAIGGGGGVSSGNGTIFFLSPELLDGSTKGVQNAPNLYRAGPAEGYAPRYVTTLESALTEPHPPKLKHVFDHDFGTFGDATALTVDHSSGDLYILDTGTEKVQKFDSAGNPVDFTAGPEAGTNQMSGAETPAGSFETSFLGLFFPTELAVDQSTGDFYIPDLAHSVVDKFNSSGEWLSQIPVGDPTAVAVDQADGEVFVSSLFGSIEVFESTGAPLRKFSPEGFLSSVAVDSSGTVYVTQLPGLGSGETEIYNSKGKHLGTLDKIPGHSVAVDSSNDEVYVDQGEAIARFDSTGTRLETFGAGSLTNSGGVTIDPEGNLYATNAGGTEVATFLPHLAPDPRVDNPAVLDSVSAPGARHTADFQITSDGEFAAFPSTLALAGAGEEPAGHTEIYRYDAVGEELACASCQPAGIAATSEAGLASDGLSLTAGGSLFFNTTDPLALADTDNKLDVYEWEPQGTGNCQGSSPSFDVTLGTCRALISAGTSSFDSGLLSADADGQDVYFFTRDSLVPQDTNGPTMKIYDARVEGGFPYEFPPVDCRASDECHGASSPTPPPIEVGSEAGTPHNEVQGPKPCKKGSTKKHGRCVASHPHKHKHKHNKRAASRKRGGVR